MAAPQPLAGARQHASGSDTHGGDGTAAGTAGSQPRAPHLQDVRQPAAPGPQADHASPSHGQGSEAALAALKAAAQQQQSPNGVAGLAAAPAGGTPAGAAAAEAAMHEASAAYKRGDYGSTVQLCQALYSAGCSRRADLLLLLGAAYFQLGQYREAVQANDQAILLDPGLAEAHANLANALQQLGAADLALMYYASALRLRPRFTDALANMASAYLQKGAVVQAMDAYNAALAIDPDLPAVHTQLGDLWRAQGEAGRTAAAGCYADVLRRSPEHAPAWRGVGDVHREAGEGDKAIACYQEALRLAPRCADAHTGLGMCHKEQGRLAEAEACFGAVVALRPGCALALGNLAGVCYDEGKLEAAIALYRRAISAQPHFPEAHNNLGNALREAGRADEAIAAYTACIQLQVAAAQAQAPLLATRGGAAKALATQQAQRLSVAYNNLAGILKMSSRLAECIQCYEHVVFLQPASPEAYANLASALKDCGRHDEALGAYRSALSLRQDFPEAFANYVHSLQCVCEWAERPALFARLQADVTRDLAAGRLPSVQPFHAMAYPFPADLALSISKAYAQYCLAVAQRMGVPRLAHPPSMPLAPGQRLRVGYVSSDFGNHPLSHLMGSVFGMHDRSKVEVFCYALSTSDGSQWRTRIEAEADHFVDVSAWPAAQTAARMSADGLHVAVNLNGYTKGARNEVFALQPAPVQTSFLGFPATTGASFLPWLILDKVVCPPSSRHCYSEAIAYMPNSYFSNDYKQAHQEVLDRANLPSRTEIGLPEDKVIYACANQLYKFDPETFGTWCRILCRVPDSVLWLLRFPPYGEARIKAEAAARGVDPARVIFTDVAAKPLHIRRSGVADLFLDTPLCNAHTTGCDVLWGGCPMVTLPLERFASRVAASLCHATGLGEEMVVSSQQEYEERAVELGLDAAKRASLRARLASTRLTCPLFDTAGWVADFERTLLRMWDIHCEGRGPRDFETPPAEAPRGGAAPTLASTPMDAAPGS
ncbi:putative UDP-N-acetylglucosamine-peptide N-acetylglucosaminyltransferase SEC [Micractinium conductrix]|uniref:protein O-GlcNAc transferase n=1 Tax=Micractinium conductrix TaxID=554055 RepID=A0A2P6VAB0_9CHLO|nr:putative UDP-N-acetylglucosamine-peptide N-acetylglucosaminyltransferase SEC [Micractinium conductrix]|eukprot:PSC71029.1 putative UDP-N-acetylglucosamine-peptide N-acetylglucosaminyltransferase SEC [Micractinium conductrix]